MSVTFDSVEHRPESPEDDPVELVRLSPDGKRVIFSRPRGKQPGIWAAPTGAFAQAVRVVAYDDEEEPWRAEELAFAPDSAHFAYVRGGGPAPGGGGGVGWANAGKPGELGRTTGLGFAWTPKSSALIVADPERGMILRRALGGGPPQPLAKLSDDGDPAFPPRIAVSPDGGRIAFTSRRAADEVTEVHVITRTDEGAQCELLTEIPGAAVHVRPFWSPKGGTLAMLVVHLEQEKSAIIAVPKLEGEGVVLYENELLDAVEVPAWAPSGHSIAFFHVPAARHEFTKSGPALLTLLDVRKIEEPVRIELGDPDQLTGAPHFLDDRRLAIDGRDRAHVLTFAEPP